jgi:hypothetical protein
LLSKLRQAVVALDPYAAKFLKLSADEAKSLNTPSEPAVPSTQGAQQEAAEPVLGLVRRALNEYQSAPYDGLVVIRLSTDEAKQLGSATAPIEDSASRNREALARPILRMIRRALNEYTDDRYDSFVTARNRTWGISMITGLMAFSLLSIAMMMQVPRRQIVAGMVFFLIGATVGLLNQLRKESDEKNKDIPDYGLSAARLYATPFYCGLTAVGGVILFVTMTLSADALSTRSDLSVESHTTKKELVAGNGAGSDSKSRDVSKQQSGNDESRRLRSLTEIFDLDSNLQGLLVAAVFGLTPGLFLSKLQEQSEKYKSELKSSEPTQSKA